MRIGILSRSYDLAPSPGFSLYDICEKLKDRGHEIVPMDIYKARMDGDDMSFRNIEGRVDMDAFICWLPPYSTYEQAANPHSNQRVAYFDQVKWLSDRFPSPTPYKAQMITNSKSAMSKMFRDAGLPCAHSFDGNDPDVQSTLITALKSDCGPFVAKPNFGWGGNGVEKIETVLDAQTAFAEMTESGESRLLQNYIECNGIDYRAYVVGDQVIAGIKRTAQDGEWRGNYTFGPKVTAHSFTSDQKKDAVTAMQVAELKFGAVDILVDPKTAKHFICEINDCAGTESIENANDGLKTAPYIVDMLEHEYAP